MPPVLHLMGSAPTIFIWKRCNRQAGESKQRLHETGLQSGHDVLLQLLGSKQLNQQGERVLPLQSFGTNLITGKGPSM